MNKDVAEINKNLFHFGFLATIATMTKRATHKMGLIRIPTIFEIRNMSAICGGDQP
jgi:hypothetical protein